MQRAVSPTLGPEASTVGLATLETGLEATREALVVGPPLAGAKLSGAARSHSAADSAAISNAAAGRIPRARLPSRPRGDKKENGTA
jgi:hypothetical protein